MVNRGIMKVFLAGLTVAALIALSIFVYFVVELISLNQTTNQTNYPEPPPIFTFANLEEYTGFYESGLYTQPAAYDSYLRHMRNSTFLTRDDIFISSNFTPLLHQNFYTIEDRLYFYIRVYR